MTRLGWLLTALIGILLVVGWYFLVFAPTSDEIDAVRAETGSVRQSTQLELARAAELRAVREAAPEAEARLAFGRSLIPEDPAFPALFRQLQQAVDDSGGRLESIVPSEPTLVEVDGVEYSSIAVSMTLQASYFQAVDIARRIEDPRLTPRAVRWVSASISPAEFPTLDITLSGEVFSRGFTEIVLAEEPVDEAEPEGDDVAEVENDEPEGEGD